MSSYFSFVMVMLCSDFRMVFVVGGSGASFNGEVAMRVRRW